jgi:serine/threonine protein kinase
MAANSPDPVNVTSGQFARNLADSGLLDLADLVPDAETGNRLDGALYAKKLVEAGKLTGYQADAVLARRFNDLRIGNYEIIDRLGAGGMGTVYKARHRRMKRVVALKVLSKEVAGTGKFADRFQREIETIARLTHPNIVMAFDADEGEPGPFLVMEYVNGRDLASEVEKNGPLSVADAVDRILQAARGLEYAHAQGIVHRDIKPGNILRDADGVVKVADLGLARFNSPGGSQSGLTQAGTIFGTVEYMSPEQAIDSGQVDRRADIYSLGCTLYFLLTGRPPYQSNSVMATLLKHRDHPIPDLAKDRPDLPPTLIAIYRTMMAKSPDDRYPSMSELIKDLERPELRAKGSDTGVWTPVPHAPAAPDTTAVLDSSKFGGTGGDTGHFDLNPSPAAGPVPEKPRQTALIVEPSRTQAGITRRYLQQIGLETVHQAGSGIEALNLAKTLHPDVIISSMHLSDMTGVQLAQAVLGDPALGSIGFVVATSEADSPELGSIPTSPRLSFMAKPFDLQRLSSAIRAVTGDNG